MDDRTVRRTVLGALVGGGVFAAGALYRTLTAGGELTRFLGPTLFMAALGATVGGLAGPLVGRAVERHRRSKEEDVDDAESPDRVQGGRQPLWITLLTGIVVGWAVGTAWEVVWAGVALGLVLAGAARVVFR